MQAIADFGFPVGPMVLVDEVGFDVAAHVHENLRPDLKERMSAANIAALEAIKVQNMSMPAPESIATVNECSQSNFLQCAL
jgi:3-hydroxyacyl-CoA dehydrogenase